MSTALITGVSGQDGGYLAERLLADDVEVHAVSLPCDPSVDGVRTHVGDVADIERTRDLVLEVAPDEIYNLAAVSSVARSWDEPELTARVNGMAAVGLLESAHRLQERAGRPVRFVQASSAEIFGLPDRSPQDEDTPVRPVNPYGAAKAFAHLMVEVYRHRGLHAVSLVLYNHESPRRPATFVARKIAMAVARISLGIQDDLVLGNIDVHRDWGYAPDYVEAMIRIIEQPEGGDYIVATGESHSVREFVGEAFTHVGIADWESLVKIDPALYRPADPQELVGDPARLRAIGWVPTVGFSALVHTMVDAELAALGSAS
jgi:GDPmannose 4,6-dehydratase